MDTSADFGIPFIPASVAAPEEIHNEAVSFLQIMINGAIDRAVNTPAVSPTEGDTYIIGGSPTGVWSGKANKITQYIGTAWAFFPNVDDNGTDIAIGARHEGLKIYVRDEDCMYVWDGAAWVIMPCAMPSSVVASLGSAAGTPRLVYCTNETGGAVPVFSDGAAWRRVTDRNVAS